MRKIIFLLILSLLCVVPAIAQSPNATINGIVLDPSGAVIVGAEVVVVNDATGVQYTTKTNGEGIYVVPNLPPGPYRIQVSNSGFKTIIKPDIVIHVQDALAINFTLPIGAASEIVTVTGGTPLINTESGSVSTVIDRHLVENLPLNGRSFNTLLQLTPGVVIVPANSQSTPGQFSINGQRTNANSFYVDGVSVNFGTNAVLNGQSGGGGTQAFNAYGGTSSLVSVDAVQEFRVETSTFAPQYGRTPGGQVDIVTRSGTNNFHGDVFDYFRNDALDANTWFANSAGKPRAPERQNDFGGVFGGPIFRNSTFFFFSYEGLRLRQPQTTQIEVPSAALRSAGLPVAVSIFSAYPQPDPNALVSADGNVAQFTGTYSNAIAMDAVSMRFDHTFNSHVTIFGRYNWSPSQIKSRVGSLSNLSTQHIDTTTVTLGTNGQLNSNTTNSLRFNYSRQIAGGNESLDSFGGAKPLTASMLLPSPFSVTDSNGSFVPFFDGLSAYSLGLQAKNQEAQWNVVDDLSITRRSHQLRFGIDYRRLLLTQAGLRFSPQYLTLDPKQLSSTGTVLGLFNQVINPSKILFPAFSTYAQDRWSLGARLTLTYGLRWELNPAPSGKDGTVLASWESVDTLANTTIAPVGTPPWKTTYGNFAPRVGVAYRVTSKGDLVVRGGWGMFYDLGTGVAQVLGSSLPNSGSLFDIGAFPVPIINATSVTPSLSLQPPYSNQVITAFAPDLNLPYSQQWNVAVEKSLWGAQSFSLTYLGQVGRRLLRGEDIFQPNTNFPGSQFVLTRNGDTSDYHALQAQFRRPLSRGVQALLNYTWSHSIDTNSDDAFLGISHFSLSVPGERGSSDFDVRQNFTGAFNFTVPSFRSNTLLSALSGGWSLNLIFQTRTGFPINIFTRSVPIPGQVSQTRPDLVSGQPFWLYGSQCASVFQALHALPLGGTCPGGKGLNPDAFALPAVPRQGTLGRNAIYGFGATELGTSLQRRFGITERVSLIFKVDVFNLLNHPNFFNPVGNFDAPNFGLSPQTLSQGLGGLNSLYQIGGPRSIQLSLKLLF